jgi:hypothetical protein
LISPIPVSIGYGLLALLPAKACVIGKELIIAEGKTVILIYSKSAASSGKA